MHSTLQEEYWTDVRETAESLAEEARAESMDRESFLERMHETIDGHSRVIYSAKAQECLRFSPNDNAYFEEFGDPAAHGEGINWSLLAFCAFERDVYDQLDAIGFDVNAGEHSPDEGEE